MKPDKDIDSAQELNVEIEDDQYIDLQKTEEDEENIPLATSNIPQSTRNAFTIGRTAKKSMIMFPDESNTEKNEALEMKRDTKRYSQKGDDFFFEILNMKKSVDNSQIKEGWFSGSKRKVLIRMLALSPFYLLLITLAILLIVFHTSSIHPQPISSFTPGEKMTMNLVIQSCTIDFEEENSLTGETNAIGIIRPHPISSKGDFESQFIQTEDTISLTVKSPYQSEYCNITVFMPSTEKLGAFNLNCDGCVLIQNSKKLSVAGATTITGTTAIINMAYLETGTLNLQAEQGFAQFNMITVTGDDNVIEFSDKGDIILQSDTPMDITFQSPTQTFCFGGPVVNLNADQCSVSGEGITNLISRLKVDKIDNPAEDAGNTNCAGTVVINTNPAQNAGQEQTFTLSTQSGNIYANLIAAPQSVLDSTSTISKSASYDNGIDFDTYTTAQFNNFMENVNNTALNAPILVLTLGNGKSLSSSSSKWAVVSNPAYEYIKPWWLSALSASLLDADSFQVQGQLLPGICPWTPTLTLEDYYSIATFIKSANSDFSGDVILVSPETSDIQASAANSLQSTATPQSATTSNDQILLSIQVNQAAAGGNNGIQDTPNTWEPWIEDWLSINRNAEDKYIVKNHKLIDNSIALLPIIFSFLVAIIIGYAALCVLFYGINYVAYMLISKGKRQELYTRIKNSQSKNRDVSINDGANEDDENVKKDPKKTSKTIQPPTKTFSLIKNIKYLQENSVFISTLIDFAVVEAIRRSEDSRELFFEVLFRPESDVYQDDTEFIRLAELREFYQEYCYLSNLSQNKFTPHTIAAQLEKRGFHLDYIDDSWSYGSILMKSNQNRLLLSLVDTELDSLSIFMKYMVIQTNFIEDVVDTKEFAGKYDEFCKLYRLEAVVISPHLMKQKFKVSVVNAPKYVIRKSLKLVDIPISPQKDSPQDQSNYIIDRKNLKNLISYLTEDIRTLKPEIVQQAKLTLYSQETIWYEILTILLQYLLMFLIMFPVLAFLILVENGYSPYSLSNPLYLLDWTSFVLQPTVAFTHIPYAFQIFALLVILMNTLDLIFYMMHFTRPIEAYFKDKSWRKDRFGRFVSWSNWCLLLTLSFIYFIYLALIMIWILLGAIINPSHLLPYAAGTMAFLGFAVVKFTQFTDASEEGAKSISEEYDKYFNLHKNDMIRKMAIDYLKSEDASLAKAKDITNSSDFQNTLRNLADVGILDLENLDIISNKLESLTMDDSTQDSVSTVQKLIDNPNAVKAEMDKIVQMIESKYLNRVQQDLKKSDVSDFIVKMLVSFISRNKEELKANIISYLEYLENSNLIIRDMRLFLISVIFPSRNASATKNKLKVITKHLTEVIFHQLDQKSKSSSIAEKIVNTYFAYQSIQSHKYDQFAESIRVILEKNNPFTILTGFKPNSTQIIVCSLDLMLIFMQKNLNNPALKLVRLLKLNKKVIQDIDSEDQSEAQSILNQSRALLKKASLDNQNDPEEEKASNLRIETQPNEEDSIGDDGRIATSTKIDKFQYLMLYESGISIVQLLNKNDIILNLDTKQPASPNQILNLCHETCISLDSSRNKYFIQKIQEQIGSIMGISLFLIRNENKNIPIQALTQIISMNGLKFDDNDRRISEEYLQLLFDLHSLSVSHPEDFIEKATTFSKGDFNEEMKDLIIFAISYKNQLILPRKLIVSEDNKYLKSMLSQRNLTIRGFMNLIHFISDKKVTEDVVNFLDDLINVFKIDDLSTFVRNYLRYSILILTSRKSTVIYNACQKLKLLPWVNFILISKELLAPEFMNEEQYNAFIKEFKLDPSQSTELLHILKSISNKLAIEDWKIVLINNLKTFYQSLIANDDKSKYRVFYSMIYKLEGLLNLNPKNFEELRTVLLVLSPNMNDEVILKLLLDDEFLTSYYKITELKTWMPSKSLYPTHADKRMILAAENFAVLMNMNPDFLKKLFTMLFVNDKRALRSALEYFFPKEISKMSDLIDYVHIQNEIIRYNNETLYHGLPNNLKWTMQAAKPSPKEKVQRALTILVEESVDSMRSTIGDRREILIQDTVDPAKGDIHKTKSISKLGKVEVSIPPSWLRDMHFGHNNELTTRDISNSCKFINTLISFNPEYASHSSDLKSSSISHEILRLGLLNKGYSDFQSGQKSILQDLITLLSSNDKRTALAEYMPQFSDPKNPVCMGLTVYAIFNDWGNETICETKPEWNLTYKDLTAKQLGSLPAKNINPVFFDIFKAIVKKDISSFIDGCSSIIKHLKNANYFERTYFCSILSFLNCQFFNFAPIANEIGCSPDLIEFVFSLYQLKMRSTRTQGFTYMESSVVCQNIFKKLNINSKEFAYLMRLLLSQYDESHTLDKALEIFDPKSILDKKLLAGVNRIFHAGIGNLGNIDQVQLYYSQLRGEMEGLYEFFNIDPSIGSTMMELRRGNFLILQTKQSLYLDWIFGKVENDANTVKFSPAGANLMLLTQGLCGLINTRVHFIDTQNFAPRLGNTLEYAVSLASSKLFLDPIWLRRGLQMTEHHTKFSPIQYSEEELLRFCILYRMTTFFSTQKDLMGLCGWHSGLIYYFKKDINNEVTPTTYISLLDNMADEIHDITIDILSVDFNSDVKESLERYFGSKTSETQKIQTKDSFQLNYNNAILNLLEEIMALPIYNQYLETLPHGIIQKANRVFYEAVKELKNCQDTTRKMLTRFMSKAPGIHIRRLFKCFLPYVYQKLSLDSNKSLILQRNQLGHLSLSIISGIISLRRCVNADAFYANNVFELNILATNIERKIIFHGYDEWKMYGKFGIMKLLGLSRGFVVLNAFELFISTPTVDIGEADELDFVMYRNPSQKQNLQALRESANRFLEKHNINEYNFSGYLERIRHQGQSCAHCSYKNNDDKFITGYRYHCKDCEHLDLCSTCYESLLTGKESLLPSYGNMTHKMTHHTIRIKTSLDSLSSRHLLYTYCPALDFFHYIPGHENDLFMNIAKIDSWTKFNGTVVDLEKAIILDTANLNKFIEEKVMENRKDIFANFDCRTPLNYFIMMQQKANCTDYKTYPEKLCMNARFEEKGYYYIDLHIFKLYVGTHCDLYPHQKDFDREIDIRTGVSIKNIEGRVRDFENTLMKPNMKLLLELIEEKYDYKNFMSDSGPERRSLYTVLFNLMGYHVSDYHAFTLRDILMKLPNLVSDQKNLEDLLEFSLSKEVKSLDCAKSLFELPQKVFDSLRISLDCFSFRDTNLRSVDEFGEGSVVPENIQSFIQKICKIEDPNLIALLHGLFNLNKNAWLKFANKCTLDSHSAQAGSPLSEIIQMINFSSLNDFIHSTNSDDNLALTQIPNVFNFKHVSNKVHTTPYLVSELVFLLGNAVTPDQMIDDSSKEKIEYACTVFSQILEFPDSENKVQLLDIFFSDYHNPEYTSEYENSHNYIENLEIIVQITKDFNGLMIGKSAEFNSEESSDARLLAWLLYVRKEDFKSITEKMSCINAIFQAETGIKKKISIYKRFKPPSKLKIKDKDGKQKIALQQKRCITLFIAYIKWDLELLLLMLAEIEPNSFAIISSVALLLNWNFVLRSWVQKNKEQILDLKKSFDTYEELAAYKKELKKDLKPLTAIISLALNIIKVKMHGGQDVNKNKEFVGNLQFVLSQKELILKTISDVQTIRGDTTSNCSNLELLEILKIKWMKLRLISKQLKKPIKSTVTVTEPEKSLQPKKFDRIVTDIWCLEDFFMVNFDALINKTGQQPHAWVYYNNYVVIAEHYYSKTFFTQLLSRDYLSSPSKSVLHDIEEHILLVQNLIREISRYDYYDLRGRLQIFKDLLVLMLENISRDMKCTKEEGESSIKFIMDLVSIISGFDFNLSYKTKCINEEKLKCDHCRNDELRYISSHLSRSLNNYLKENNFSLLNIGSQTRLDLLMELIPTMTGITIDKNGFWTLPLKEEEGISWQYEESIADSASAEQESLKSASPIQIFRKQFTRASTIVPAAVQLSNYKAFKDKYFAIMDYIVANFMQVMNDETMLTQFIIQIFKELDKIFKLIRPNNTTPKNENYVSGGEFGKVAACLYKMTIGDISDIYDLIYFTTKDRDRALSVVQYLQEASNSIDLQAFKNMTTIAPKNENDESYDYVKYVLNEIKNGRASNTDLFKLLDKTGNSNDKVDIVEFQRLFKRLGVPLTKHIAEEVFAEVKSLAKKDNTDPTKLNEEEFVEALAVIKSKNVLEIMEAIGITPEILYTYLVYLLFLLLLIFSFIFLGIRAFAIGGAFSAIINSILPGIGAVTVAAQDNNKKKIDSEFIKKACKVQLISTQNKYKS